MRRARDRRGVPGRRAPGSRSFAGGQVSRVRSTVGQSV
jgi:hypothetical protein